MKMGYLDRAPFGTAQLVEEAAGSGRQTFIESREQNLLTSFERYFRETLCAMQCDDGFPDPLIPRSRAGRENVRSTNDR